MVTHAGGKELEEPLVVRPTSETIINHMFAKWIKSHRDLPMLINQWANVVRWEMRTRLFLRTSEFLWQEGHTAHATEAEATEEALRMLDIYAEFAENAAAVSVVKGIKSANERFAGATRTYSIEAMMKDMKALQAGTSHELGQNFSKAFDIQFSDEENNLKYPYQTSWGVSTRLIGMIIMAHGDDKGLNLPPKLAPYQVVIIPITPNEESSSLVLETTQKIVNQINGEFRVHIDDRDNISPGFKFNEWELKGVPLRIEIGPRDIENNTVVFSRRDGVQGKFNVPISDITTTVSENLDEIHNKLLEASRIFREDNTKHVENYEELISELKSEPGFVTCYWDENSEDEDKVKQETKATLRCYVLDHKETAKAVNNKKIDGKLAIFSKAY
jgi:prolyl-tRNA synthetase